MTKVLLVEDDNNLREIYEARLAAEGYDISSAQDGEEALVVAKQTKPDLVISDVMMPKISGFEMLDIMRNTAGLEHVKVIMLTALGQSEDRDRADNLGADKYLVKSQVTLEDIVKTAHELLDDAPAVTVAADSDPAASTPAPEVPVTTEVIPMATAPEAEPATEASVATETPAPAVVADDASAAVAEPVITDTPPPVADDQTAATVPGTQLATDAAVDAQPQPDTAAQEENLVTNQIDSFVSNLPDEVETPVAAQSEAISPEPTPETPVEQPTAEEAAATTADDKIMANAVNELAGEDTDQSTEPTTVIAPGQTAEAPSPEQASAPEVATEDSLSDAQAEANKTNISINGKKTIQPLDSQPKPDINELLAREEATSGSPTAATAPVAISTPGAESQGGDSPAIIHQPGQSFAPQPPAAESAPANTLDEDQPSGGPAPTPSQKEGIDPNSIAL